MPSAVCEWGPEGARKFDGCLDKTTATCTTTLRQMGASKGRKLSPLMKFDL